MNVDFDYLANFKPTSGLDNYIRFRQVLGLLNKAFEAQGYIFPHNELQDNAIAMLKVNLSNSIKVVKDVLQMQRNKKSSKA